MCFCFEKLFFLKFSFFFSTKCYDEQAFRYYAMVRFPIIGLKSDSELTIRGKSDNLSNSRRIRVKEKMIRNTTFNKIIFLGFKGLNLDKHMNLKGNFPFFSVLAVSLFK